MVQWVRRSTRKKMHGKCTLWNHTLWRGKWLYLFSRSQKEILTDLYRVYENRIRRRWRNENNKLFVRVPLHSLFSKLGFFFTPIRNKKKNDTWKTKNEIIAVRTAFTPTVNIPTGNGHQPVPAARASRRLFPRAIDNFVIVFSRNRQRVIFSITRLSFSFPFRKNNCWKTSVRKHL